MSSDRETTLFEWVCAVWVVVVGFIAITFRYCFFTWLTLFIAVVPPIALATVPIAAIVVGIRRLIKRRFREGALWLLVPVAGAAVATLGYQASDSVIFRIHKPIYDAIVSDAAAGRCSEHTRTSWPVRVDLVNCGSPVIVVIPWGGFLSSWYGVVYDSADQISKPPEQRSDEWRATEAGKILKDSSAATALGGHYYLGGGDY